MPFSAILWGAAMKYLAVLKSSPSTGDLSFAHSLGTIWTLLQLVTTCQDCKQLSCVLGQTSPRHCWQHGMGKHLLPHALNLLPSTEHLLHTLHAIKCHPWQCQLPPPQADVGFVPSPPIPYLTKSRGVSKHSCLVHEQNIQSFPRTSLPLPMNSKSCCY